jgi:hypothetical protein
MRGRYGSASVLPPDSVELASALGRHAKRGRDTLDLALMAWLDGAPVTPGLVQAAIVNAIVITVDVGRRELSKAWERYGPPEEFVGEDPTMDWAEVITQWVAENSRDRHARRMRRRLAAAGYGGDNLALANVYMVMMNHEAVPEEDVDRVLTAFGLRECDRTGEPDNDVKALALGFATGAGVKELTGTDVSGWISSLSGVELVSEALAFSVEDVVTARRDLGDFRQAAEKLGVWEPGAMPSATDDLATARALTVTSALWAVARRNLPAPLRLVDILNAGVDAMRRQHLPAPEPAIPAAEQQQLAA